MLAFTLRQSRTIAEALMYAPVGHAHRPAAAGQQPHFTGQGHCPGGDKGVIVEQGEAKAVLANPKEERTRQFLRKFLGTAASEEPAGKPEARASIHIQKSYFINI